MSNFKKSRKGFIDPLSLVSIGFLFVSLIVGVVAVSKSNIKFDIRKRADVGNPEYGTTSPLPSPITISPSPIASPLVYSDPESIGCSPCNCSGISTCPYGGQIKCISPNSCKVSPIPSPNPISCTGENQIPTTSSPCCNGLVTVSSPYGKICNKIETCPKSQKCQIEGGISFTYTCSNGYWTKQSRCDFGCSGDTCRVGGCRANEIKCDGNIAKKCSSDGSGWTSEYCTKGCSSGVCIKLSPSPSALPTSLINNQTDNPCLTNPRGPECAAYQRDKTNDALIEYQQYQEDWQKACSENPNGEECKKYQTAQTITIGTSVAMAGIPLAVAGLSGLNEIALSAYIYGTTTLTTLPAWAQTGLTTAGITAGWYGIAQGTKSCNENPGSMGCSAFLAGVLVDPNDFIALGNQTNKLITQGIQNVQDQIAAFQLENIRQQYANISEGTYLRGQGFYTPEVLAPNLRPDASGVKALPVSYDEALKFQGNSTEYSRFISAAGGSQANDAAIFFAYRQAAIEEAQAIAENRIITTTPTIYQLSNIPANQSFQVPSRVGILEDFPKATEIAIIDNATNFVTNVTKLPKTGWKSLNQQQVTELASFYMGWLNESPEKIPNDILDVMNDFNLGVW